MVGAFAGADLFFFGLAASTVIDARSLPPLLDLLGCNLLEINKLNEFVKKIHQTK